MALPKEGGMSMFSFKERRERETEYGDAEGRSDWDAMYVADCTCIPVCFKCEKASKESGLIHVLSVEVIIWSTSVGRCGYDRDIFHRRVDRSPSLPSLSMAKKIREENIIDPV
jgi:hypothetical protein